MNHLIARQTGVYGLYAFNSIGGSILNSEAYYVNDGAFYIGQTPPQSKPVRTIVRNVDGWGSPLGFSATNMRYVTITKSRFYNNAVGLAPERAGLGEVPARRGERDHRQRHLLEQLQLPPGHRRRSRCATRASPRWRRSAPAILLLGGKGNRVENNRIYGNFLTGVTAVESILVTKTPAARTLERNVDPEQPVRSQRHRRQRRRHRLRRQRNGQLLLDGRRDLDVPRRRLHLRRAAAARTRSARPSRTRWSAGSARAPLKSWNKHPHPPKPGYHAAGGLRLVRRLLVAVTGAALVCAAPVHAAPSKKSVRVGDNFFAPKSLTVDRGSTVTWKLAGLRRGGGRPRRRAEVGAEGREEVRLGSCRRPTTRTSAS